MKRGNNFRDFLDAISFLLPIVIAIVAMLIFIEIVFERLWLWFLKRALERKKKTKATRRLAHSKTNIAGAKLVLPYLYSIAFLPFFVTNQSILSLVLFLWITIYTIRMFIFSKSKAIDITYVPRQYSSKDTVLWLLMYVILVAPILALLFILVFQDNEQIRNFILTLIYLLALPISILYILEWRSTTMPRLLRESNTLSTVPHKIAPLVNLIIKYGPWLLLLAGFMLGINKLFLGGSLEETHAFAFLDSLVVLILFIYGRRFIDYVAHYKLSDSSAKTGHMIPSYIAHLRFPIAKFLQWTWHVLFFGSLMSIWNLCFSNLFIDAISHPFTKTLTTIGIIWGMLYILSLGLDFFVQFHTKPQTIKGKRREPTIFAKTFGPMLHGIARWLILLVAFFVTLESFGFDLKILVYLMSAFAFAISLGAQSLVKDIINGFFALVDGSFAVGEVVTVGTHTGTVESLSLRAILLRHSNGSLQKIPFSEVGNIINKSRDFTVVPIDVATSYKTKIGKVYEALTKAFDEMVNDPTFGKMIIDPLTVSGIDRFADNAVHVSASIKIIPDPNNKFAQEFNRRLKTHLDALKITPPIAFMETWSKV